MKNKELFAALKMLQKEKGIAMDVLCEGIQRALVTAVKRDYNNKDIVFCELNPEDETMRVFVRKNVVSEISDPDEDILVEQAAGITNGQQVYDFIMAGSEAAGAASGIMNAADPIAMIDEMIAATRRAADDLKKQEA